MLMQLCWWVQFINMQALIGCLLATISPCSNKAQCRGWVGFSVKMAHRITAGCDILLMPSRFEPCGLNQVGGAPASVLLCCTWQATADKFCSTTW
jgi:hypothetical protein